MNASRPRPLVSPLRLLVALIVLVAGFVSGTTVTAIGNGVAAINFESSTVVEAVGDISPGHVGSDTRLFDDGMLGCCVAPRTVTTGGARVSHLGDDVVRQVDDAIERAAQGKIRFPGHDGKVFSNADELLPSAGPGYYSEWTAAASGAKRGTHRVIVGGNPASPDVIYYWDHAGDYVQVWP